MDLKNFHPSEFECGCGCGKGYQEMDKDFLARIIDARKFCAVPFIVTSAFRCSRHNSNVGGNPQSSHMTGHALDIQTDTGRNRYIIIHALLEFGLNRIGIAKNFVHVDNDPSKPPRVIWMYD